MTLHMVFQHKVTRDLINPQTPDYEVLRYAAENDYVLITCNRYDFLAAAKMISHAGLIILIRRNSRMRERVALFRLLDKRVRTENATTSTSLNSNYCKEP